MRPAAISRNVARAALAKRRRGGATLWLILAIPVLLVALCLVLEIGNLRVARIELENAMEAAALAAAQEWGRHQPAQSTGWTQTPRNYGVAYAAANQVRGASVSILTNYDPSRSPNENASYTDASGNLVFGAIDETDPNNITFEAGTAPGGGLGTLLVDASANPSMQDQTAWGIRFYPDPLLPAGLVVERIEINLRAGVDANAVFVGAPTFAPAYSSGVAAGQVAFSFPQPFVLRIDFSPSGGDLGLEPGDFLRFGARTNAVGGPGSGTSDDGDAVGRVRVGVRAFARIGATQYPPTSALFLDSEFGCNVGAPGRPIGLPLPSDLSLPCTPSNDNQSFALLSGAGNPLLYGVHAKKELDVPSVCGGALGLGMSFRVRAQATAAYDRSKDDLRLIRIDTFDPATIPLANP